MFYNANKWIELPYIPKIHEKRHPACSDKVTEIRKGVLK